MADPRFREVDTHPLNDTSDVNDGVIVMLTDDDHSAQRRPLLAERHVTRYSEPEPVAALPSEHSSSLDVLRQIFAAQPSPTFAQRLARESFYSLGGISAIILIGSDFLPPGDGVMPSGTDLLSKTAQIYVARELLEGFHHTINQLSYLRKCFLHYQQHSLGYNAVVLAKRSVVAVGSMAATAYSYSAIAHAIDAAAKNAEEQGIVDSPYYTAAFLFGGLFTSHILLGGVQRGVEAGVQAVLNKLLVLNEPAAAFDVTYAGWRRALAGFANMMLDTITATSMYEFVRIGLQTFEGMATQELIERSPGFPPGIAGVGLSLRLYQYLAYQPQPMQQMIQVKREDSAELIGEQVVSESPSLCEKTQAFGKNLAPPLASSIAGVLAVFFINQLLLPNIASESDPENMPTGERLAYYGALALLYFTVQACLSSVPSVVSQCRSTLFGKSPALLEESAKSGLEMQTHNELTRYQFSSNN